MRILLAAAALALVVTPALACGWGAKTVQAPQAPSTVATDAPQTPIPPKPQG